MHPLLPTDPDRIGPYRLEGRLGAGGMGEVFLAHSPGGRRVAVKVIRPIHAADPRFRSRFAREIEAAQRVGGFHTAQVIDADPEADSPWLVTAYIPGRSLHAEIAAHGPLGSDETSSLGAGLSEGLAAIHACGLVHRDVKPGNIIMSNDGPRLIDFGIARPTGASSLTSTGVVIGTFAFMSPEQVRAERAEAPSDIFSLGAVLTFAATGKGPFDAETIPAIVHRIVNEAPSLGRLSGPLRVVVEACLAKNPAERPGAERLIVMLAPPNWRDQAVPRPLTVINSTAPRGAVSSEDLSTVTSAQSVPPSADHSATRSLNRRKLLGLAGGALVLVGGGVLSANALIGKEQDAAKPPTPLAEIPSATPLWLGSDPLNLTSVTAHPDGVICMGTESAGTGLDTQPVLWNVDAKGRTTWQLPLPDFRVIRSNGIGAGVVYQGAFSFGGSGLPDRDGSKKVPTQLVTVDLAHGRQSWSQKLTDSEAYVDAVSGPKNGLLYATSTTTARHPNPVVWAVDIASRQRAWAYAVTYEKKKTDVDGSSTLVVPTSGDRVFHLASTRRTGQEAQIQAFRTAPRHLTDWKTTVPEAIGDVSDQPCLCAAADALVYASTSLIGLDPASGDRLWTNEQPKGSYDGFSTPAASPDGSVVYVAYRTQDTTDSGQRRAILTLQALDPGTGHERWRSSVVAQIGATETVEDQPNVLVDGSTVYVLVGQIVRKEFDDISYIDTSENRVQHPFVWALNARNGASRWRYNPPESFTVSAHSGRLYIATPAGVVALSALDT
ncbi:protein kinase domain-containing protein [Streptomyces sp. NPDC001571]